MVPPKWDPVVGLSPRGRGCRPAQSVQMRSDCGPPGAPQALRETLHVTHAVYLYVKQYGPTTSAPTEAYAYNRVGCQVGGSSRIGGTSRSDYRIYLEAAPIQALH